MADSDRQAGGFNLLSLFGFGKKPAERLDASGAVVEDTAATSDLITHAREFQTLTVANRRIEACPACQT